MTPRYLNVTIHKTDNNDIAIKFDSFLLATDLDSNFPLPEDLNQEKLPQGQTVYFYHNSRSAKHTTEEIFYYMNSSIIDKYFNHQPAITTPDVFLEGTLYKCKSLTRILPTTPHVAINFLYALSLYLTRADFKFNQICIGPMTEPARLVSNSRSDNLIQFLEGIIELQDTVGYEKAMADIKVICQFYKDNWRWLTEWTFGHCVKLDKRARLLCNDMADKILNPDISSADKIKYLSTLSQAYIQKELATLNIQDNDKRQSMEKNLRLELSYKLSMINQLAKRRLYETCFNQVAHDTKKYDGTYTELLLIRHAEFDFSADGRLQIINLEKNLSYQEHYAAEKKNHSIIQEEFAYLGKLLAEKFFLGEKETFFDLTNDIHKNKTIIFTQAATNLLKAHGLHFTEVYIKELLKVKNYCGIFNSFRFPDPNDNQEYKIRFTKDLSTELAASTSSFFKHYPPEDKAAALALGFEIHQASTCKPK